MQLFPGSGEVFEDKLSLDDETLMKLTAGYAAGMGCLEATCGALIGAVMTAGVLTDGAGTPRYSKEILAKFQQKCGATICRELKASAQERYSVNVRNA